MSCEVAPKVGDVNTALVAELVKQDGTALDVSAATVLYIYLTKPSGTTVQKTAAKDTTGSDGKIRYNTVAGDLDESGVWRMQGYAETPAGKWSGDETTFEVKPSRHASYVGP